MTNLEVDVMEGDVFTGWGGNVYQYRGNKGRRVWFGVIEEWKGVFRCDSETPLDLPTFTRYCEGCGLTVKMVKPEPKVETIKPPEFWLEWNDGGYTPCVGEPEAKRKSNALESLVRRVVRIDWGAK